MKAQELRIGNWVEHEGAHTTIDALWYENAQMQPYRALLGKERSRMGTALININPIPLSPEVLTACGFEIPSQVKFLNKDWYICIEPNGVYIQVEKNDTFDYGICERLAVSETKYLHQLQNLIYCLTGEELNYTP
jgi:hypothetical protein